LPQLIFAHHRAVIASLRALQPVTQPAARFPAASPASRRPRILLAMGRDKSRYAIVVDNLSSVTRTADLE
jgi:hypothetical protein